MPARALTKQLGGAWYHNYGQAACPVCQPERRKDQHALTISWQNGKLLLRCKKGDCKYQDILDKCGGFNVSPDPALIKASQARKLELGKLRIETAILAGEVVEKCEYRPHPYLSSKGFPNLKLLTISYYELCKLMKPPLVISGSDQKEEFLCIPLTTPVGNLSSIQLISRQGVKCFLPGGRIGGAGWFPCESGARPLVLCEGAATLLSVLRTSKRIGSPVSAVACMSAGGIVAMGRIPMGDAVMADNDVSLTGMRAAQETGLLWKMPATVGEDFNDVEQRSHAEADELLRSLTLGMAWTVEKRASPPARAKALSQLRGTPA